jgi:TonB family protein
MMNPKSNHNSNLLTLLSFLLPMSLCLAFNATASAQAGEGASKNKALSKKSVDAAPTGTVYYILWDGAFVEGKLDKAIEPIGGFSDFFRQVNIKYPARARQSKVQGTVWITTVVDESGKVVDYFLSKGIGSGCDEEALRAMSYAREIGFDPPLQNGAPVKVKFDVPFKFVLQ